MSQLDRDNDDTRDCIDGAARRWLNLNHRMGNRSMSLDDARRRVVRARSRGDTMRENGNR